MKSFLRKALPIVISSLTFPVAYANSDVTFIGSVTEETCEVLPDVDGAVSNTVQMGRIATSSTGSPIKFRLKAADPTSSGCTSLLDTDTATIAWSGPFDSVGLKSSGVSTATDSHVLLSTVNAKTGVVNMVEGTTSADFTADKAIDGFEYNAQLKSGIVVGNFTTAAAYTVAYK
ncbi:fimbrial protein [Photobacterium kishitanii]|uniref:hypothetical protein n=1 Tax=Photobacterium kishitanii TaxID=318456 RepID=UPI0005D41FB7|nr:hypothetical protein [Photobacterium kishitanii]KJG09537.1 hypothetical protein UB40_12540 [Photobacterium kishitanii]PSV07889.1 fimbrial protein [Photobacterium kishitanii]PSV71426.1 fimbrial protein [Photobacterium kishitanii]